MTVEAYIPKYEFITTSFNSANIDMDLSQAKVLDLYGNAGTLLNDPANDVEEENYVCVDCDLEAIEQGTEDFPDASFRFWDRHNQMIHPQGQIDYPIPLEEDEKFDLIFNHMKSANIDPEILFADLDTCYKHLNPGGVIIFAVFMREVALNYFVVRRTHEYGMLNNNLVEDTENAGVFALINNDDVRVDVDRVPTEGDDAVLEATHYTWFWNNNYLTQRTKDAFPEATVTTRRLPPMWSIQNPIVIQKP